MKFYTSFFCHNIVIALFYVQKAQATPIALPIVDLGYALHKATLNATGPFPLYSFSNIRYAQAPVGSLRFSPPLSPIGRNDTVNDGRQDVICPQAFPVWFTPAVKYLTALRLGQDISNFTTAPPPNVLPASRPAADPITSEDCLFLDVVVPRQIFEMKRKAPVLVWIYGGGFTLGDKKSTLSSGNPATLVSRSLADGKEGIIYVAMNYRLGLFGFLAGSSRLTPNVGLLDQRLALEWVQQHIAAFGGDPNRVTIMGESAGGGSILHQITAYGGHGNVPFQRAIPQSGGFAPRVPAQTSQLLRDVLGNASLIAKKPIKTISQLKNLPYETLYAINTDIVGLSPYTAFTFGPVVDGNLVPDLPQRLLAADKYHKVDILVGHNSNEGYFQAPPFVQTQTQFVSFVQTIFPFATPSIISYITTKLYPNVLDGSAGYTTQLERTADFQGDLGIDCVAFWLASFVPKAFAYLFSVANTGTLPPGIHGQDIGFTFFNGESASFLGPIDPGVAASLQNYLVSFAMTGKPTAKGVAPMVVYGKNHTITNIGLTNTGAQLPDPAAKRSQCAYWLAASYQPRS